MAGRRSSSGLGPSIPRNDTAAKHLSEAASCMANTPGGGALIVGVADDRTLVGTAIEAEWLRMRIYELTQRRLTTDIYEHTVQGTGLLVIRIPEALEPIRFNNRIKWRVADNCVEIDAATWHQRRMIRLQFDWSAQDSQVPVEKARPTAVEIARDFLLASNEDAAQDLARASTQNFLKRLNVVTNEGTLTNAGALAFVGRDAPAIDYIRRDFAGSDSTARLRAGGRSILEELSGVMTMVSAHNSVRHISSELSIGQVRDLPPLAIREAIVNGLVHREWGSMEPTVVEHVGQQLTVTSPGGFVGGVTPENIITHPSSSRNKSLAELFASLRIAEREGIGVDRIIREMLRLGHALPEIQEISGPYVRTALLGQSIDLPWLQCLNRLEPRSASTNLNFLLILDYLTTDRWIDESSAMRLLQVGRGEALATLEQLDSVSLRGAAVVTRVQGVPSDANGAWALAGNLVEALTSAGSAKAPATTPDSKRGTALSWASHRGRISSTELASIVGGHPNNAGRVLRALESDGLLSPGRANRNGAGFFYRISDETRANP
ncbi:ATP-binding protein [Arthrobacter sp. H5]|uniref:ATP-binding protein n=1 Tax=Arthrobacter sp. H5 TaxID=1267973 RepID=UPI0004B89676|nr:ATP-binding protein [Arthrobacter sp. H5]